MKRAFLVLCVFFVFAAAAHAQRTDSVSLREAVGARSYPAAPRLAQQVSVTPAITLDSINRVMPERVLQMQQRNADGIVPMQNGIGRPLADPIMVQINGPAAAKSGIVPFGRGVMAATSRGVAWSGGVQVTSAQRLRLHLSNVKLSADAVLWVYGNGEAIAFSRELLDPNGGLWTPSMNGETIHLEIEIASGTQASFNIDNVLELIDGPETTRSLKPNDTPSCLVDVTCVGVTIPASPLPISQVERAIAHLEFVDNGSSFVCTGGLVNDRPTSNGNPAFLLTANHCISTQASASSLQAFWDYRYPNCSSSTIPPLSSLQVSNGSTLLTTASKDSGGPDVTLLRLNSIPSNRLLLGWDPNPASVSPGTTLYRISHPAPEGFGPQPQQYSSTSVVNPNGTCTNLPTSRYLYSSNLIGGTYGGSSGSPVMIASGQVVGQLYGGCAPAGHDPGSGCDTAVMNVDGAFSASYPLLKQFIDSGSPVQPSVCTPSSTTMCLSSNRFAVSATWRTHDSNGAGTAVRLTDDTGYFWFFGSSNVEAVVKVLNACSFSSKFWVFAGGLTNVNVVLTVIDTKTGTTKTYTNPIDTAFQPIQDTSAFATCP
jgi:lysyl endopeptidase